MRNGLGIAAVGAAAMMLGACGGATENSTAANNVVEANQTATASITGLDGPWAGGLPAYPRVTAVRDAPGAREDCSGFYLETPDTGEQVISYYRPILEQAGFTDPLPPSGSARFTRGADGAFVSFSGGGTPALLTIVVCPRA